MLRNWESRTPNDYDRELCRPDAIQVELRNLGGAQPLIEFANWQLIRHSELGIGELRRLVATSLRLLLTKLSASRFLIFRQISICGNAEKSVSLRLFHFLLIR